MYWRVGPQMTVAVQIIVPSTVPCVKTWVLARLIGIAPVLADKGCTPHWILPVAAHKSPVACASSVAIVGGAVGVRRRTGRYAFIKEVDGSRIWDCSKAYSSWQTAKVTFRIRSRRNVLPIYVLNEDMTFAVGPSWTSKKCVHPIGARKAKSIELISRGWRSQRCRRKIRAGPQDRHARFAAYKVGIQHRDTTIAVHVVPGPARMASWRWKRAVVVLSIHKESGPKLPEIGAAGGFPLIASNSGKGGNYDGT